MPGATPVYGLPYPVSTDRLDAAVTTIPHDLATALETTLQGFGGIANPGGWTTLTPAAGANAGAPYRALGYRKVGNKVECRGRCNLAGGLGAGGALFGFPVGFRPTATLTVLLAANTPSMVRAEVNAAGTLTIQDAVSAGGFIALDALIFTID